MADESCIFCRIAKGDIPCAKVYEDDTVLAFLDLAPASHGHTLVIPKEHYPNIMEVPSELGSAVFSALSRVSAAVMSATGAAGINVIQNNGVAAGQTVFHIHWHIIPRFEGDDFSLWTPGSYPDAAAMQEMAAWIASLVEK